MKEVKKMLEKIPYSVKTVDLEGVMSDLVKNLEHIPPEELRKIVEKYRKVW